MSEPRRPTWWIARALLVAAAGMAVLGVLCSRVLIDGERELRASEALMSQGDLEQAAVHARRSASWYLPGAPHVPAAYSRLITIAQTAEGRGDPRLALFAWQAVRSAALSSRWIVVARSAELNAANAQIARLSSQQRRPPGASDATQDELERQMSTKLAASDHPRVPWAIALIAGFAMIAAGMIHIATRGMNTQGAPEWGRMRLGLAVAGVGVATWALALWQA